MERGKAFERRYPETKPSSQHCLGQTKQINRQPLLPPLPPPSPTSSRSPALSSPSSSFAPCALAPTPCMQANPLPFGYQRRSTASVHLQLPTLYLCPASFGKEPKSKLSSPSNTSLQVRHTGCSKPGRAGRLLRRSLANVGSRSIIVVFYRWNVGEDGVLGKKLVETVSYESIYVHTCVFFGTSGESITWECESRRSRRRKKKIEWM